MIYSFDTSDEHAATAALLVYAIYRSRDKAKYKVSMDMWEQIERFTKDAAKRSKTLPNFIEALKPRLSCGTIKPRWMAVGLKGEMPMVVISDQDTGAFQYAMQAGRSEDQREFLTQIFERADARQVIKKLYADTAWIILLVRDRIEREKPIEAQFDIIEIEET